MPGWTTRLYKAGDETAITNLYESVFKIPMPIELWRWRYLDNPMRQVMILLAISSENGSLVGQYSLCPVPMKIGDKDVIGSLSIDTMVHPNFRGQGMFIELANKMYNQCAQDGIRVVYGFPNSQSYKGFIKNLAWKDLVDTMPIYVRPLKFRLLLAKILPTNVLPKIAAPIADVAYSLLHGTCDTGCGHLAVEILSRFDERIDFLWQKAQKIKPVMVRRDSSYLNWRYASHPTKQYTLFVATHNDEVKGYAVLRVQEQAGLVVGFIADLLTLPGETMVADALIEAAVSFSKAAECDIISCFMLDHIPYVAALKRRGFMRVPAKLLPQEMHLGARNNFCNQQNSLIFESRNWYITWGDHDVI